MNKIEEILDTMGHEAIVQETAYLAEIKNLNDMLRAKAVIQEQLETEKKLLKNANVELSLALDKANIKNENSVSVESNVFKNLLKEAKELHDVIERLKKDDAEESAEVEPVKSVVEKIEKEIKEEKPEVIKARVEEIKKVIIEEAKKEEEAAPSGDSRGGLINIEAPAGFSGGIGITSDIHTKKKSFFV